MELQAGVQGDVLVQGDLLHLRDQVLGDGQEEEAVAEGQRVRSTPGYSDSHLGLNIKFEEVSI